MKNDYLLVISIAGFISVIFLCSFFKIGVTFSIFLIFLSLILLIYRKIIMFDSNTNLKDPPLKSRGETSKFDVVGRGETSTGRIIFLVAIFMISFSLGIFRYELTDSKPLDVNLENNIGEKVVITGVISDEPKFKEKQAILVVDFRELLEERPPTVVTTMADKQMHEEVPPLKEDEIQINTKSSSLKVEGRGIVSTDLYPELKYGDLIKISGKLEKPENFINTKASTTSVGTFDYISYLGKDDIFYKIDFAKTEFVSGGHGNLIKGMLFKIKNAFISNLDKTISSPEAPLLSGILLGSKSSIDQKTSDIFRKAGLSHIVALSGYNITIVAEAIMKFFSFLPRTFGFLGGILGIILFVVMSGATSTAVRAGVMALIVILAQATRRNYQAGRALIIAGLLMVIINPKILVFDISFQLSFLATIAIIYVAPIMKNKFIFVTEKFGLRDTIASTISAQILVLPLILYKMGLLSLVALPANILVLAFIPATMLFGFITGILGFIWIPLSLPVAWISWLLLAYIIKVSEFFASLPFSSLNITWFSLGVMTFCYIIIVIWIIIENKNFSRKTLS